MGIAGSGRLARWAPGALALWVAHVPTPALGVEPRPLFDGHIHYNADAVEHVKAETAIAILDRAGITRALVSSTPDDGTVALHRLAPDRVVPVLRPYRTPVDRVRWFRDPGVLDYVTERLALGVHRGIGEFHVDGRHARSPVIARMIALAAERQLFLHAHSDQEAIEILAEADRRVRVLWAHGGMTVPPETIGEVLDRHPNLWVELSYRYEDIAPRDALAPPWRALFLRHPERFILGTDTWTAVRWEDTGHLADAARRWLEDLPPDVASGIAEGNAQRFLNP